VNDNELIVLAQEEYFMLIDHLEELRLYDIAMQQDDGLR
jgi:hypothetical protein